MMAVWYKYNDFICDVDREKRILFLFKRRYFKDPAEGVKDAKG